MIQLAIVLPCYNEEPVLPTTIGRLLALKAELVAEGLIREDSTITFVDDGSTDRTWSRIEQATAMHGSIHGIKLARNCSQQNALLAGLLTVPGDAVVSIDADLQDDPKAIREMVLKFTEGAQIVYGVCNRRDVDTLFKKISAESFYQVMRVLGVELVVNHADYRLMSRSAIEALRQYDEVNLFLPGIVPQLGFPTEKVFYARVERAAGGSKYPSRKMPSLAWNGLTSFTSKPLRWITLFGVLVSFSSFAFGGFSLVSSLVFKSTVPGWASTVIPIYFLGGIQLLGIGMLGEYLVKIHLETKRRPRFIVERKT